MIGTIESHLGRTGMSNEDAQVDLALSQRFGVQLDNSQNALNDLSAYDSLL